MSHALYSINGLPGGNDLGFMSFVAGEWRSAFLTSDGSGPADSPVASHYHTGAMYGGGGTAYSSTRWATVLAFIGFGRLYLNNSATLIQSTDPPSVTNATGFPMAISLPAGQYLSVFTVNDGLINTATYAEIRQYSTKTNGTDGQYHSHRTRVSAAARFGSLSIARLSFSEPRNLYLRAITFGGASGAPVYAANQSVSFQIVRINAV